MIRSKMNSRRSWAENRVETAKESCNSVNNITAMRG